MATRYEITPTETCPGPRTGEFFKCLSGEALHDFEALESLSSSPAATAIFAEEQTPSEVFILLRGYVKLIISSSNGKRFILRIAKPGEFLGLTSAFTGSSYAMTAETLYPSTIASVRRSDFLDFLLRYPAAYQNVARELSLDYDRVCDRLRTIGLASSACAKFAGLLLEWSADGQRTERGIRFRLPLTHGEIGEFIGVSRETVTRTLNKFRHRQTVDLHGSMLTISNRLDLEDCAACDPRSVRSTPFSRTRAT
jgi:CRP-like cAMP-binding protein